MRYEGSYSLFGVQALHLFTSLHQSEAPQAPTLHLQIFPRSVLLILESPIPGHSSSSTTLNECLTSGRITSTRRRTPCVKTRQRNDYGADPHKRLRTLSPPKNVGWEQGSFQVQQYFRTASLIVFVHLTAVMCLRIFLLPKYGASEARVIVRATILNKSRRY